jgi:hypothetical protein
MYDALLGYLIGFRARMQGSTLATLGGRIPAW